MRLKSFYYLTKPGIIYGNAITAAAGFFFAARAGFNPMAFIFTLLGLSLVIASACVSNNVLDRRIDALMPRTRRRALATGRISPRTAVAYAAVLGVLGALMLVLFTNLLTLAIALFGWVAYVIVYGYAKRHTVYGTEVGSISGAVPPVVGYVAVTNHLDAAALILFLILVVWQMPHFYAIAIFRKDDYAAAEIPVMPVRRGIHATKIRMLLYILAFIVVTHALTAFGFTGYAYAAVAAALGLIWLAFCIRGFWAKNNLVWARQMFVFSLVVIVALSVMIAIGR